MVTQTARPLGQTSGSGIPAWIADKITLFGLGVPLEETFLYLAKQTPSFDEFERWILERNGGSIAPACIERINAAITGKDCPDPLAEDAAGGPVLSVEDLATWNERGYVVVHGAVSPANCRAAEQAIWEFLGMNEQDPESWYSKPYGHTIMVPLYHHPAFQANRDSRRIHRAFAQIWGATDLWITVDRGGFNPPERPGWRFPGPNLHWDTSLAVPIPFDVQGILYLTDTSAEQGAFTCVPGFQHRIESWLASLPCGADPRRQPLEQLGAVPIPGRGGDLVIWNHALPHGSRPNTAARPRIVQYISMFSTKLQHNPVWK